jgi:NIMA (never in mitosis gene a)-related kinase
MSINDFEQVKEIGSGSFGTVLLVKRKTDGEIYAMKRVKVSKMSIKDRENALNEVRMLASLRHTNVIDYKEAFYDEESTTLNIVMEHADEGDLANKIKNHKTSKKYIPEADIWSYLIQLIHGLKSLHTKKIMHRDLKSANIFLTKNGVVKIGDLNVSKLVKLQFLYTQTGTPYYASPEVWSEKPYDFKSDIWSLGCIIYEMTALKPPFRAQSMEALYKSIMRGVYEPIPNIYSKELRDIIATILQIDPSKRPHCDGLLNNSLIKKKMDSQNVNLTSCQGQLLKTIRWPLNTGEINILLPKYKRYHTGKASVMKTSGKNFNSLTLLESMNKENSSKDHISHNNKLRTKTISQTPTRTNKKPLCYIKRDTIDLVAESVKKVSSENSKVVSVQSRPMESLSRQSNLSVTPKKNFDVVRKIAIANNSNKMNESNGNSAEILSIHTPLTKNYKLNNLQFKNRSIFNNLKTERNKSVQPDKKMNSSLVKKMNLPTSNVLIDINKKFFVKNVNI